MKGLTISTGKFSDIQISELDNQNDFCFEINGVNNNEYTYINAKQAQEIIDFLKQQLKKVK